MFEHLLDRALRSQGVISLDSDCYLDAPRKTAMAALIEARLRRRRLVAVAMEGAVSRTGPRRRTPRCRWTSPTRRICCRRSIRW